jgi:predicted Fe-Mo cluster-binding NifX family protein
MKTEAVTNMKVALATWNGRVSPVFDVARQVLMLDVENGCATARHAEPLPGTDPQAQAARMAALAPDTLICGAISQPMAALLEAKGVRVIPFTAGPVEEVLAAWLAGALPNPALSMPGCCGRMRRGHGGRAGGRGRGAWEVNEQRPPNVQM